MCFNLLDPLLNVLFYEVLLKLWTNVINYIR